MSFLRTVLFLSLSLSVFASPLCTSSTLTRAIQCQCSQLIPTPAECTSAFPNMPSNGACTDNLPKIGDLSSCRMIRLTTQVRAAFETVSDRVTMKGDGRIRFRVAQQSNVPPRDGFGDPNESDVVRRVVVSNNGAKKQARVAKLKLYNNIE